MGKGVRRYGAVRDGRKAPRGARRNPEGAFLASGRVPAKSGSRAAQPPDASAQSRPADLPDGPKYDILLRAYPVRSADVPENIPVRNLVEAGRRGLGPPFAGRPAHGFRRRVLLPSRWRILHDPLRPFVSGDGVRVLGPGEGLSRDARFRRRAPRSGKAAVTVTGRRLRVHDRESRHGRRQHRVLLRGTVPRFASGHPARRR